MLVKRFWREFFWWFNCLILEHLDFMNVLDLPVDTFEHFKQLEHDYIGYQSLTDVPRMVNYNERLQDVMVIQIFGHITSFFYFICLVAL